LLLFFLVNGQRRRAAKYMQMALCYFENYFHFYLDMAVKETLILNDNNRITHKKAFLARAKLVVTW